MTERMAGKTVFVACEAGAAAWMAPVWQRLEQRSVALISATAQAHLKRAGIAMPDDIIPLADDAVELVVAMRPRSVVASATGRPLEATLTRTCQKDGVAVTQVVDTWTGYERRFGSAQPHFIAVIDAQAEAECRAAGAPDARYVRIGHPAWETTQPLPPADSRRAVVVGQPILRHYRSLLGYDEATVTGLVQNVAMARPDLIQEAFYLLHVDEKTPPTNIEVIRAPRLALETCGTVIGMFSSLLVDALLAGRRVIVLQPGDGPDLFGPSRHGIVPRLRSATELKEALERPAFKQGSSLRATVTGSTERMLAHLK